MAHKKERKLFQPFFSFLSVIFFRLAFETASLPVIKLFFSFFSRLTRKRGDWGRENFTSIKKERLPVKVFYGCSLATRFPTFFPLQQLESERETRNEVKRRLQRRKKRWNWGNSQSCSFSKIWIKSSNHSKNLLHLLFIHYNPLHNNTPFNDDVPLSPGSETIFSFTSYNHPRVVGLEIFFCIENNKFLILKNLLAFLFTWELLRLCGDEGRESVFGKPQIQTLLNQAFVLWWESKKSKRTFSINTNCHYHGKASLLKVESFVNTILASFEIFSYNFFLLLLLLVSRSFKSFSSERT